MKRLAIIPAAFLLAVLWAGPASAHAAAVTTRGVCVAGTVETTVTFTNDFDSPAAVSFLNQAAVLPALGQVSLTALWTGSAAWQVTWADEFQQSGTVTAVLAFEGCVPPTITTAAPPTTVAAPTTVAPLPAITATSIAVDVSLPPAVVERTDVLAFTGSDSLPLTIAGFSFVALGFGLSLYAHKHRTTR